MDSNHSIACNGNLSKSPELQRGPPKLPHVLQLMMSLQNECQQDLELRQELISQLRSIQRENHALKFALSRKSKPNAECKSPRKTEISVLSSVESTLSIELSFRNAHFHFYKNANFKYNVIIHAMMVFVKTDGR